MKIKMINVLILTLTILLLSCGKNHTNHASIGSPKPAHKSLLRHSGKYIFDPKMTTLLIQKYQRHIGEIFSIKAVLDNRKDDTIEINEKIHDSAQGGRIHRKFFSNGIILSNCNS